MSTAASRIVECRHVGQTHRQILKFDRGRTRLARYQATGPTWTGAGLFSREQPRDAAWSSHGLQARFVELEAGFEGLIPLTR